MCVIDGTRASGAAHSADGGGGGLAEERGLNRYTLNGKMAVV